MLVPLSYLACLRILILTILQVNLTIILGMSFLPGSVWQTVISVSDNWIPILSSMNVVTCPSKVFNSSLWEFWLSDISLLTVALAYDLCLILSPEIIISSCLVYCSRSTTHYWRSSIFLSLAAICSVCVLGLLSFQAHSTSCWFLLLTS